MCIGVYFLKSERELFLAGVEHFNSGRFYESHEDWEEVWLQSEGSKKLFYQIMILLAAVGVHYQKMRQPTALRVQVKIQKKIDSLRISPFELYGLNCDDLQSHLNDFKTNGVKSRPKFIVKITESLR